MTEESREKVDFLSRYKYLKDNLKVRYDELDEVMTMATKVTSCSDGMPHGSGVSDKIAVAVEQMKEIENSIADEILALLSARTEISSAIQSVNDIKLRTLLEYRYISGYSWEDVADAMGYEQRRVFALHGLALEKVQIPERCHKNAVKCSANM